MWENWLSILSIILWIVVPTLIFIARHWLIAWVSGAVQHNFDSQIEEVRADLRNLGLFASKFTFVSLFTLT